MAVSRPPAREEQRSTGGPSSGGPRGPKRQHRKVCAFCAEKIDYIDYKEVSRLRRFVSDRGKILPRRVTGTETRNRGRLCIIVADSIVDGAHGVGFDHHVDLFAGWRDLSEFSLHRIRF